jgi:cell division protein FtsW
VSAPRYAGGPVARFVFLGSALFLTAFGLVMIFSASSITAAVRENDAWHFFFRQGLALIVGLIAATVLARFDYRALRPQAKMLWLVSLVLLVAVLVVHDDRGGAARSIPIGSFQLQPSEFAKIACVLLMAVVAVDWQRKRIADKSLFGNALMIIGVPSFLIILQPDMGTMATLVVAVALVLILAGVRVRWIAASGSVAVVLGVWFIKMAHYRMDRVVGFMNPFADPAGKGYQIVQALYAFGSGGIAGVGLGMSRQKFFYLPEAHTDFILAIIGEEAGLIGTLAVVVGFVLLVWAGYKIASGAKDPYGRLVAGALTGMIGFQAILNMAAVTGMFPVTGKPLPFVSYGGSSVIATMACVGLILSISRYGALAPRAVRARPATKETASESAFERRRDRGARVPRSGRRGNARRRA